VQWRFFDEKVVSCNGGFFKVKVCDGSVFCPDPDSADFGRVVEIKIFHVPSTLSFSCRFLLYDVSEVKNLWQGGIIMRIFVSGVSGNVGTTIVRALRERDGFELAGGWCLEDGQDIGVLAGIAPLGIFATSNLAQGLKDAKPDVVIDFSATPVLPDNLRTYLDLGLNVVVGTTGLTEDEIAPYKKAVQDKKLRWTMISNYGVGLAFVMDFLKKVRPFYPYVSIIDRHPARMKNAPSGTAVSLAKAAKGSPVGEIESKEVYPHVLASQIEGAQVIAQRMPYPGPYSEHEITLGRKDETLTITVCDHSSEVYMDGVFMAAEKLGSMPPGTFARELSEL
jgi:4-hydroxy-tetrahydrodipicolinate reductase